MWRKSFQRDLERTTDMLALARATLSDATRRHAAAHRALCAMLNLRAPLSTACGKECIERAANAPVDRWHEDTRFELQADGAQLQSVAAGLAAAWFRVLGRPLVSRSEFHAIIAVGTDRRFVGRFNKNVAALVESSVPKNARLPRLILLGTQLHREMAARRALAVEDVERITWQEPMWRHRADPIAMGRRLATTLIERVIADGASTSETDALDRPLAPLRRLAALRVVRIGPQGAAPGGTAHLADTFLLNQYLKPFSDSDPVTAPAPWPVPDIVTATRMFLDVAKAYASELLFGQLLLSIHTANWIRMLETRQMQDHLEEELARLRRKVLRLRNERITREIADLMAGTMSVENLAE